MDIGSSNSSGRCGTKAREIILTRPAEIIPRLGSYSINLARLDSIDRQAKPPILPYGPRKKYLCYPYAMGPIIPNRNEKGSACSLRRGVMRGGHILGSATMG